ncbi:hypothetical protein AB0I02_07755 [Streptomyces phaeochromogenes]
MAAQVPARQQAREIAELSAKSLRRIVRLGGTANAYLRVIAHAKHDPVVVTAVERYLLAARRAEKHADTATRDLFAKADDTLAQQLTGLTGPDIDLLRRETAQRPLAGGGERAGPVGVRGEGGRGQAAARHRRGRRPPRGPGAAR